MEIATAMAASTNAQSEIPEEAFGRLDLKETIAYRPEEPANRAVNLLHIVDALLTERSEGKGSTSCNSAPILAAPPSFLLEMAEEGDAETLFLLLEDDRVDIRNCPPRTERGDTPLHLAAGRGHLKAVLALLDEGARVNVSGHRLRTPLHCAAAHGHLQVVRCLILLGTNVNEKDADGATALELATAKGFSEVVGFLLKWGAQGEEILESLVCSDDNKEMVRLFLDKGVSVDTYNEHWESLLVHAARAKCWEVVALLLERGACPRRCNVTEECALVYASKDGQADAVRVMLRSGAACDAEQVERALADAPSAAVVRAFVEVVPERVRGQAGAGGLAGAAAGGRLEPLVALLDAGVQVDIQTHENHTALHCASRCGHTECVRELLERGADVSARDNEASTPLHWASQGGHVECVRALLGAGASAAERNSDGKTPLDVAKTDEVRRALTGQ